MKRRFVFSRRRKAIVTLRSLFSSRVIPRQERDYSCTRAPIFALLFFFCSCSIHTPEVKFTGEKTALENQILGTYSQVQEDMWMVASVRAANPDSQATLSEEKRAVLAAMQNREFNKDDVEEFKRDGAIGENNKGLLELRPLERLQKDPAYRKLVEQIVAEENRDREIVLKRIAAINPAVQSAEPAEVEKAFAQLQHDGAKPGDWLQAPSGEWLRKK